MNITELIPKILKNYKKAKIISLEENYDFNDLKYLAEEFAFFLSDTDENFDKDKFMEDCGLRKAETEYI